VKTHSACAGQINPGDARFNAAKSSLARPTNYASRRRPGDVRLHELYGLIDATAGSKVATWVTNLIYIKRPVTAAA
jgi:hypothetical protein